MFYDFLYHKGNSLQVLAADGGIEKVFDFRHGYENRIDKLWGRERWIVNNDLYCGKVLDLNQATSSSIHYHKKKTETFHVIYGKCFVSVFASVAGEPFDRSSETVLIMRTGDSLTLGPFTPHKFYCSEEQLGCTILEISTPHSDEDVVRIEQSKLLVKEEYGSSIRS